MKLSVSVFAVFSVLALALPSIGQSLTNPAEVEPPVLADTNPPGQASLEPLLQTQLVQPLPPQPTLQEADAPADRYHATVENLASHRHQFVHFKLRNGKVLTGLIRSVGKEGFTLHTDALGGPYIRYEEIAEQPRPVPAVGTRIKHGAEWTGLGIVVAVAIPLLIVFSPLVFMSGWSC